MHDGLLWLVIAAVLFGVAALASASNDPRAARVPLVALGLLALTLALIVERT